MKVGILTFHNAINYGAILQVYALKHSVQKIGLSAEVINYQNIHVSDMAKKRKIKKYLNPKKIAKFLLLDIPFNKKIKSFGDFSKKYLELNEKIISREDLKILNNKYDKFIVGSDQVWNIKITNYDTTYMLDFVEENYKKTSYAASIGIKDLNEKDKNYFKHNLNKFSNISVRENEAKNLLYTNELVEKSKIIHTVLDPTLLLNKEEWANTFNLAVTENQREKYMLVYAFLDYNYLKEIAIDIAKKKNLKIYWITASLEYDKKIKYIRDSSPIQFLELFYHADYILTNSFHGTAFAINFNKDFNVELLVSNSKVNSRMENLLKLMDLNDRIVSEKNGIYTSKMINYERVNNILENERNNSLNYLQNALVRNKNE